MNFWLVGLIILIVSFVTFYLKIKIDRFFLVLLLMLWFGFDINKAIIINALVMFLASLLFIREHKENLTKLPRNISVTIILTALTGAFIGRLVGSQFNAKILIIILGVYAVLVGLRLLFLKPRPVEGGDLSLRISWIPFIFSILTGLISAGGKPLQIPMYTKFYKIPLPKAHLIASLGTMSAVIGLLLGQMVVDIHFFNMELFAWSWIYYAGIISITLLIENFWSQKGQKWVTYIVAPLLIIVGIRLFF